MGDSVFHYTDIDGLVGILSSKSLFATHYNYLNDLNKGEIIRDLIIPILEVDFTQFTQKGLLKANIYERYGTSVHRMLAEIIYDAMRETTNNVSPFFLSSFCEHSRESNSYKNGLLSQWRGYGSAAGFAIEFDKEQLVKIIELEFKVRAYASISSGMVRYSKYDEIFNPEVYRGLAGELTRQGEILPADIGDFGAAVGIKDLRPVYKEFVRCAPFLKDESFEEENEYRIVAVCIREKAINPDDKRPPSAIKFRSKNNILTPCIELFGGLPLPIRGVIVGPHQHQKKQVDSVRMIAEQYNMQLDIRASSIPFRM